MTIPEPNTWIVPQNCKMRFLNVCATLGTDKLHFRTLLINRNLGNGFTLNIRVFVQFGTTIFVDEFATLSSELRGVARDMRAKGCKVVFKWELEQAKLLSTDIFFPRRTLFHRYLEAQMAEEALSFSATQWEAYFRKIRGSAVIRII